MLRSLVGSEMCIRDRTNITPQYPLPLAGYGARKGAIVSTVHDSVWARGFVFDDGFNKSAIITLDALIIPPAVTETLRILLPEIGYSLDKIFLSATHTHCSVGGWANGWIGTQFAGEYEDKIVSDLANAIITTIKKAETINSESNSKNISNSESVSVVTKKEKEILQIIYFDLLSANPCFVCVLSY